MSFESGNFRIPRGADRKLWWAVHRGGANGRGAATNGASSGVKRMDKMTRDPRGLSERHGGYFTSPKAVPGCPLKKAVLSRAKNSPILRAGSN